MSFPDPIASCRVSVNAFQISTVKHMIALQFLIFMHITQLVSILHLQKELILQTMKNVLLVKKKQWFPLENQSLFSGDPATTMKVNRVMSNMFFVMYSTMVMRRKPTTQQPMNKFCYSCILQWTKVASRGGNKLVADTFMPRTKLSFTLEGEVKWSGPLVLPSGQSFCVQVLTKNPSLDAKLSDICIGTSAAPTYLPSLSFQIEDSEGKLLRDFNLIDGGVAANNPDDTLRSDLASMDLATEVNLKNLVKVGEELLKKPVTRVNLDTGICEPYHDTTNEMALKKYILC
ncbi:hypothetical protein L6452_33975 [Arctium lappa]|uniref:Uncharacterized protein n=1 Tax=Arctium lappa TaxID=4217 RepID=A0ACB8YG69_ARCLA|nr:hypothetical protein L6452_33975 [Arctium lappa]